MAKRILFGLFFLAISIVIPFFFNDLLFFTVGSLHIGWVLGTILIRLAVIVFVFVALVQFFRLSEKTRRVRTWITFTLALLLGFGISFISPIYNVDYGNLHDDFSLADPTALEDSLSADIIPEKGHSVIAFFTTSCPHCMAASTKLGINLNAGQTTPVTAIFPGTESDATQFLQKNRGEKFNLQLMDNDDYFVKLSGGAFPSIFLIDSQGNTTCHWTGDELNYTSLDYLKSLEQ